MWAIRRASINLNCHFIFQSRVSSFYSKTEERWIFFVIKESSTRICSVKLDITTYYLESNNAWIFESQGKVLDILVSSRKFHNKSIFHTFSSHAGANYNVGNDDMAQKSASADETDDELTPDSELSEGVKGIQNELESLDIEIDVEKNKCLNTKTGSKLTKAILAAPMLPASTVLDKWVQEGNEVHIDDISITMYILRRRRMFSKALQLSDWAVSVRHLELSEHNYASRVDLIAKVFGIVKAEKYIQQIPESFRGELVYRCLLANMVLSRKTQKCEELFNKMKNLFPLSCFSCTQMLLLYKKTNRTKIRDVLLLMKKENIKPSIFTYQILIDLKGQSNDISGMEKILEEMKSNGVESDMYTQASLVRIYANSGLKDKAEAVLKEMRKKHRVRQFLLPAYVSLGRDDEFKRFWKVCKSNPRLSECISTIEALGKLKRIEDAEAVFEKMLKIVRKPSAVHFTVLLNVYTNHNMLTKGKDLIVRMAESGVTNFPFVWDTLVKLYVRAGEVSQAESILEKAQKQRRGKPLVTSYLTILDHYANRGDVHNAEKMFLKMKEVGFPVHIRSYRSLLHAYLNAKRPAYGFVQRLEADKVIPDKALHILLARADAVRNSIVAKLEK